MEPYNILINTLIIYGVYAVTREDKLFGFLPKGAYLVKPLYDCTVCMSSFWGAIYYTHIYFVELNFWGVLDLLLYCLTLAGFIYIVNDFIIELLELIKIRLR